MTDDEHGHREWGPTDRAPVEADSTVEDDTNEAINDLIDRWHDGEGFGVTLAEYIGMTPLQYAEWVPAAKLPSGYVVPVRPRKGGG